MKCPCPDMKIGMWLISPLCLLHKLLILMRFFFFFFCLPKLMRVKSPRYRVGYCVYCVLIDRTCIYLQHDSIVPVICRLSWAHSAFLSRLVGLMVKASAPRAAAPWIFFGSSHNSDFDIGTPVATLPSAWRYGVSKTESSTSGINSPLMSVVCIL